MKHALNSAKQQAKADSTLLAVLRRMASPLRHDLAGALLVPSMRLQMLRRKLGAGMPDCASLQATVDEVLVALDAVRRAQIGALGWFEQRDATPVSLADALVNAAATFNLPFSACGIRIESRVATATKSLSYVAQPLHLLLHAGFFLALDHAPEAGTLVVECLEGGGGEVGRDLGGASVHWRFEAEPVDEGQSGSGAGLPAIGIETQWERLTPSGVAALCGTLGALFEPGVRPRPAVGTLHLPTVLSMPANARPKFEN